MMKNPYLSKEQKRVAAALAVKLAQYNTADMDREAYGHGGADDNILPENQAKEIHRLMRRARDRMYENATSGYRKIFF